MAEATPPRIDFPAVVTAFAAVNLAADAVLLLPVAAPQSLVLLAKYPAALVLSMAVLGARRLAARAAANCAEDLRG